MSKFILQKSSDQQKSFEQDLREYLFEEMGAIFSSKGFSAEDLRWMDGLFMTDEKEINKNNG